MKGGENLYKKKKRNAEKKTSLSLGLQPGRGKRERR